MPNPWDKNRICYLVGNPIRSIRVPRHSIGPFESEEKLNEYLIWPARSNGFKSDSEYQEARDTAAKNKKLPNRIVFTHGTHHNIMVMGGRITGFIDWESAGWYPEYWDFTTTLRFTRREFWRYNFVLELGDDAYLAELDAEVPISDGSSLSP